MRQLIRTYKITGDHQITISNYSFTKEDVRLIINESLSSTDKLSSVLVSSTAKDNIISASNGVIILSNKTASLKSTDILTIEIDVDNIAKESTVIGQSQDVINTVNAQAQALTQQMLDNTGDLTKETTAQEILKNIGDLTNTSVTKNELSTTTQEILNAIKTLQEYIASIEAQLQNREFAKMVVAGVNGRQLINIATIKVNSAYSVENNTLMCESDEIDATKTLVMSGGKIENNILYL